MDDPVVAVLPIHLSNSLVPNVHLHLFPLLFRPLQVPPSAAESGKRIRARHKPRIGKIEVHVPVDTRKEVWNPEKGAEYGSARAEGDQQDNATVKKENSKREGEAPRLGEVRMSSEKIPERGAYMLGIVRDGHLHIHPISQTHQLRPTLTYLDVLSRKSRRSRGGNAAEGDTDSDDGPPPDPDDPTPATASVARKEKKPTAESKEVQVTAKKTLEDKTGTQQFQGGLSQVRREMLMMIREETEEPWEELDYCDGEHADSADAFESLFSKESINLTCKTDLVDMLKNIS